MLDENQQMCNGTYYKGGPHTFRAVFISMQPNQGNHCLLIFQVTYRYHLIWSGGPKQEDTQQEEYHLTWTTTRGHTTLQIGCGHIRKLGDHSYLFFFLFLSGFDHEH